MINPLNLSGKNLLITGASAGIGKEIAILSSKMGANVIMVARNEERLKDTYHSLEPGDHAYHLFDLSNLEQIGDMINKVCDQGRKVSGFVHAAGISVTKPLQYLSILDMKNIMSVNFFSFMELVKHLSKRKHCSPPASFVAISSISSRVGARGLAAYCGSKGALESAIRSMALELAPKHIRINGVAPGVIATQIYDDLKEIVNNNDFEAELIKRQILGVGKPEDVAHAAIFLLSNASRFITGTTMEVDGGYLSH